MNKWKEIWTKKGHQTETNDDFSLQKLIEIDGFDAGAGKFLEKDWRTFIESFCEKIDLRATDSVLEIGCGVGAFLHALSPCPKSIYGIDYSNSHIELAKKYSNEKMSFFCEEAIKVRNVIDRQFDKVFSNGVFHYFHSLNYAEEVLSEIFEVLKPNGRVAILDIPDLTKKDLSIEKRSEALGGKEYKKKYDGLDHTFYSKGFFRDYLSSIGFKNIVINDQDIPNYGNSKYRFNCFAEKGSD